MTGHVVLAACLAVTALSGAGLLLFALLPLPSRRPPVSADRTKETSR